MPGRLVGSLSVSLDGYGAGPSQTRKDPLGVGGEDLHQWMVVTRTFKQLHGGQGGVTGIDDDFAARGFADVGAWIMGRNMFGPIRGRWPDENWRGWWGENPPYHTLVFVLTHHPRPPASMQGGTVFHFVTEGIEAALAQAKAAAGERDVRVGGGVATIRQYLQARLLDELHLAIAPVLLGTGEHLFTDIDLRALGYECTEHASSPNAMHTVLSRAR